MALNILNSLKDLPKSLQIIGGINYGSLAIGVVISIIVMLGVLRLKGKDNEWLYEDRLFLRVAVLTLIMDVLRVVIIWTVPTSMFYTLVSFAYFIPDIVFVIFALSWLIFLDYLANKSMHRVKRFIRFSLAPILLMSAWIFVVIHVQNTPGLETKYFGSTYFIYKIIRTVIVTAYMIVGYRIISDFHRRRMEPLFMRLDFFIVPWILGMIFVYGLNLGTNTFFASIALLITYLAYKQRCKFVYRGTDAFQESFAPHFATYVEKLKLQGECAFLINAHGARDAFTEVLDQCRPEKSFLIQRDDGTYMLYTMAKRKAVLELLEQTFKDTGTAHVPPVSLTISHHIKDKAESSREFITRVISARKKALSEQI